MMNSLLLHSGFAIYHFMAWKGLVHVNYHALKDKRLSPMAELSTRFLTNWNFTLQTLVFYGYLLYDIFHVTGVCNEWRRKFKKKLDFYFYSIVAPMGIFVPVVFWGAILFDTTLLRVFHDPAIDVIMPPWLNHSVHTLVSVNVLVHAFQNKVSSFRLQSLLLPLIIFNLCYISCIYVTHYETRIWVYPFLRKVDEPYRIMILLFLCGLSVFIGVAFNYVNNLCFNSEKISHLGEKDKKQID